MNHPPSITKTVDWLIPFILVLLLSATSSCEKEDEKAKILILFNHNVMDEPLQKDTMRYINAAENLYEVNELQYFISEVCFWTKGDKHILESGKIVYIDIDIPSTLEWMPEQKLPEGHYDSVTFVFGINQEKNKSGLFVNPPERDMFWPEMMGGGYHYMKMNGKWKTPGGSVEPFNLHLGIGMKMDSTGSKEFIHNYFTVSLPLNSCNLDHTKPINRFRLTMDINSWFESPNYWDWNVIGGQIMHNQNAMQQASRNGWDAFSIHFDHTD